MRIGRDGKGKGVQKEGRVRAEEERPPKEAVVSKGVPSFAIANHFLI